jgi:PKD repeat protein
MFFPTLLFFKQYMLLKQFCMKNIFTAIALLLFCFLKTNAQCSVNADFENSATDIYGGIYFTPVGSANPTVHTWDFGDGNIQSSGAHVIWHSYSQPGNYTVKHTVADSLNTGCNSTISKTITVEYTPTCSVQIYIADNNSLKNIYVFSSYWWGTGSAGIAKTEWKLDGNSILSVDSMSNSTSVTDTITAPGEHEICVTITTASGCVSSACKAFTVYSPQNCSNGLSINVAYTGTKKNIVSFTPSATFSAKARYSWDFGNGYAPDSISSQFSPFYFYGSPGSYSIKLTVYDTLTNCLENTFKDITIDNCTVSFTRQVNSGIMTLTATSSQAIDSAEWYIRKGYDDSLSMSNTGVYLKGNPVQYTLPDTGFYYVWVKAFAHSGCVMETVETFYIQNRLAGRPASSTITSYPNPVAGSEVKMNIDLKKPTLIQCSVYNSMGMPLKQVSIKGATGVNLLKIVVDSLPKGMYYLDILIGNERKRSVFQKL